MLPAVRPVLQPRAQHMTSLRVVVAATVAAAMVPMKADIAAATVAIATAVTQANLMPGTVPESSMTVCQAARSMILATTAVGYRAISTSHSQESTSLVKEPSSNLERIWRLHRPQRHVRDLERMYRP